MNVNENLRETYPHGVSKLVDEYKRGRLETGFGMSTIKFYLQLLHYLPPDEAVELVNEGRAHFELEPTTIKSLNEAKEYLKTRRDEENGERTSPDTLYRIR